MSEAAQELHDERTLEERLQSDPDAWQPTAGEQLIGLIVDVGRRTSAYGAYPAITIRKDDKDEVVFHAFRSVAKSELARQRPVIGDRIGVLYIGADPAGKVDYHGYRIRLDRATPGKPIDWDEFDPEINPPPPNPRSAGRPAAVPAEDNPLDDV